MLSIAAVSYTGFAAPSLAFVPRTNIRMQEAAAAPDVDAEPVPPPFNPTEFAKTLPGISGPLDFFDPLAFCSDDGASNEKMSKGKVLFYREVELKHARVAMLAALGFPLAEQFHPLFGGSVDVPSYYAFQETPLQTFWPAVVLVIAGFEVFSVFSFQNPASVLPDGRPAQPWTMREDHSPGDLGFDPLGLKPSDPAALAEMQTKELNNGRLAMIAIAGMVAQEAVTGEKLF
jgi:hypothetical protein